MASSVKLEGFRETISAFDDLAAEYGKPAGKGVLRRVGIKALTPMAETARALAPDDPATHGDDLKSSIAVGTNLNRRQRRLAKKDQNKSTVTVYMGTADPAAVSQEFGNINHGPQAFMRPAFDQHAASVPEIVGKELGPEIERTAVRIARRRAAKAAKGA